MGKPRREVGDELLVVAVHRDAQPTGHVVLELSGVRDGVAVLPHIGQGPGEQVGETLLAEAEDHRGPHIEGVALALEGTATAARDQIALQDEGLRSLGGQLTGGDQTTDAGTDHNGIPLLVLAHGIASLG